MERLTKRDNDGQAMMDCEKCKADWTGKHGKPMVDCTALYCRNRLKDRLAAYEDKELEPEEVLPKDKADEIALKLMRLADLESICSYTRLRELAEADKDGRVLVLPVKTVFELTWDAGPDCDLVCPVSIDGNGCCDFCDNGKLFVYERRCCQEHIEQIDKTVFLTREEAEAALEEMKDGN